MQELSSAAAVACILLFFGCAGNSGIAPVSNNVTYGTNVTETGPSGGPAMVELPYGTQGEFYNATITPSGGTPPYRCQLAQGSTLPGELTLTQDCRVTGNVPYFGDATTSQVQLEFSFMVTDARGAVTGPFKATLRLKERGPDFYVPAQLPDGEVGVPYSYSFCTPEEMATESVCGGFELTQRTSNPSGGSPPYHFVLGSGVGFPQFGLALKPSGILGGTPTAEGERTFEVCAVDKIGSQSCRVTKMNVKKKIKEVWRGTFSYTRTESCDGEFGGTGTIEFTAYGTLAESLLGTADYLNTATGKSMNGTWTVTETVAKPNTRAGCTGIYGGATTLKGRFYAWKEGDRMLIDFNSLEGAIYPGYSMFYGKNKLGSTSITWDIRTVANDTITAETTYPFPPGKLTLIRVGRN